MNAVHVFQCDHKPLLVCLSYVISVLGAYCSLQLASQISRSAGRSRTAWLAGAAVAMGGGAIWSMHFIAMIACRLPIPVAYDAAATIVSLAAAILGTGTGLHIMSRPGSRWPRLVGGGTFTGLGVAGMHYTGMAAMRLQARTVYRGGLVAASILIAVVAATAALWLAFNLRLRWQRLGAALVMGVAVCGMHYTAMAAAAFIPTPGIVPTGAHGSLSSDDLAYIVFGITLSILVLLSVGSTIVEGRFAQENLRKVHAELESQVAARTAELARANEDLKREISEREQTHDESVRLAAFSADVGAALTKAETLEKALSLCAGAMVHHLRAATASIWKVDAKEDMLDLGGSAWERRPLFGPEGRIPVGEFRIGAIARDRRPALVDLSAVPEREDDKDWARREGMVAFAGYPLIVGERLVGVLALFARQPLTPATLDAMASVADEIALGIDRSRAAEGLRASEASTRALIDTMLTGVITTDERGRIETINPAAVKMFGWSAEELLGYDLTVLLPASTGQDPRAFLREARGKALGRVTEWEARRKNGDVFPMELALSDFQTPDGRRHSAGSVRDISERLEIERVKKEFVSTVSHELRTPLTSIRGSLGLIVGGVAGEIPARARALLDIAYKNTERLSRLVNDILDLEKIESGRMELRLEFLELGQILKVVIESNQAYAQQYSVRLAVDGDTSPVWVWVDRDRLIQVFTNLVSNAVKFSPPGAMVTLTRSRVGERVRVSVADRGPGIPEEFRPRIFQRFQQADSSDTRQKGGTGLGLAITKSIVERLNGEIGFETQMGAGTTFHVDLPEQPASMIVPEAASSSREGPRILVCEDNSEQANLLSVILQRGGCQTEIAQNATEAKALLSQRHFDAMTLDILLPGQDGISLLSELRADERTKELPIVVVSLGRSGDSPSLAGDAFGIIDWLAKPVDPARLLASVRQAAARKAGKRPRILHVEDDPDVVAVLAALLHDRADVFAAGTVGEAEKALREGSFDLLVLDIELPDGSGLNLLPLLHSMGRPPVPVVVFSAHELSYTMAQAIEAALVKSETSNEKILQTIESLLKLPQPGAA